MYCSIDPHKIRGEKLYAKYSSRTTELFKKYNSAISHDGTICIEGTDPVENVPRLNVKFDQNEPFYKQLGILKFIPHLTPVVVKDIDDTKKYKYISIFEHTLCQYAVFFMLVTPGKDEAQLVSMSYHRPTVIAKGTVKEMLRFIYDNHPYEPRSK